MDIESSSTDSDAVNRDDSLTPGFVEVTETETQIDVLHVDANKAFVNTTAEFLENQYDIFVHPASEPEDAVEHLANNEIDCIVADYDMPGGNGIELLEAVREQHPELPFILFTAKTPDEIAGKAISKGVTDYLQKGTSTAQYELLGNRIHNVVTQRRCELRAHQLEQQFVEHAEQTNNVLWTFSPDMEDLIFINSAFEDLYGISTDRFRDNPLCFLEATHPEDRLHVEEAVNRLQDGQPVDIEHRVNGKKDHQRWVQVQAQPIYDDNDEVTRIVGLITDITEQKERENQLRQFKQAVESTGQPFYFTDCDGVIEYVNPAFEETTGYSAEEVIGKTPKILQSGAHDQSFYETIWETLLDGKTWHGELFNQRKDGEQIVVEQTIAPVTDETGQINHFVAVSNDITEQKTRAQKRKQVIKRMTDGVFEVDADWRCTLISDHAQTVLGVSESELLGENLWDVFGNAQETTFETEYREVMETREPTSFVEHYEEFDRWFDVQVYPNDDGGIAVYFQDVTERKERERYLELLDRVLRHNLRNDINVIRGQAEIIHNQSMNGIGESAQKIVKKSDNLIQLAEKERVLVDILQEQPEVIDVVVRPFLKTIVTKMESTYPHATLHLECPDEITTTASAKFSKAVEELISNAIIHSKSDDPVIEIIVRSTPTGVSIAIVDDAPPIPRMEQNVLLQESEPTSLYHGGGLGLSLVRVLTSRSNGRIELDRVDAGGNRIELTLPS